MKFSIRGLIKACVMMAACNVAFAQQTIEFNSLSSDSSFHAIYKGTATYTDKVNGVFTRPSGVVGNVPVMVIMHGSGGVSEGGTGQWNDYFLKRGIATFVIDSFTPRGIKSTVADHSLLYAGGSVADALKALPVVAAIPGVDAARIGIIGFSRGGSAAVQSGFEQVRTKVLGADSTLRYALHIGFYTGCVRIGSFDKTPLMVFEGDKDDYQAIEGCYSYEKQMKSLGADLTLVVYPGATHGFDRDRKRSYVANAQTWGSCVERFENLDDMSYHIKGVRVAYKEYQEYSKSCRTTGVTVEPNHTATEDSKKRVDQFVRKHFAM